VPIGDAHPQPYRRGPGAGNPAALVEQFVLLLRYFGQGFDPRGKGPTIGEQIERQTACGM
jgi:hypothetical protein